MIIVGGSGFIGNKIYDYFSDRDVIGTYFNNPKNGLIYFNLKNPDLNNLDVDLDKIKYVIICSAISMPDDCKRNEEESYKINVECTKKLLEQCFELGIFPIWFSSEYVFDGEDGSYKEFSERNPNTVYGKQKKEIEDFLLNSNKEFLIFRLGKVTGLEKNDGSYLTSFVEQIFIKDIRSATDQIFCPLYIGDIAKVLDICLHKNLKGLYNVASPEMFSKFEVGNMIKGEFGSRVKGNVIKCSLNDFTFLDNRPLNSTMIVDKIIKDTGFKFKSMIECIKDLVKLYD